MDNIKSVISLRKNDVWENDTEANLVEIDNFYDFKSGQIVNEKTNYLLQADAFKNFAMIDWVLSIK